MGGIHPEKATSGLWARELLSDFLVSRVCFLLLFCTASFIFLLPPYADQNGYGEL